jgi:hypothetical protein
MKLIRLKSTLLLAVGVFACSMGVFSQTTIDSIATVKVDTPLVKKPKKLKFACGFGLGFIGGTNISLSPNLTYKLSNKISIGAGIQGSYTALKNIQNTITYGVNVLGLYSPIRQITTSLEFAQLRVSTKTETPKTTREYWDAALFVGAGFNITSKISLGAKYNFLYKEGESIYSSPLIPFVNISF